MGSVGLVLASGSPRRRRLLHLAGFDITDVVPPSIDESRHRGESPVPFARRVCMEKAQAVQRPGTWILAADTIVHLGDAVFGKPKDDADAHRMLAILSEQWHQVTTAWCLRWSGPGRSPTGRRVIRGHRTSRVRFRSLTSVEIDRYVETGEGRDKAGGYAVQGDGASLIRQVVGSTTNVIGLPIDQLAPILVSLGIDRGET